jgi:phospholipid/cholesterol/gamma-HCH transport system ATP-binding protein
MPEEAPEILAIENVSVEASSTYDVGLTGVSLSLRAGELALVRLERDNVRLPLADVAAGLADPDAGVARFKGEDWAAMGPGHSCRSRARIGRVFAGPNWVSNLDVDENVVLAQRHHTRRPDDELTAEADQLARSLGLSGLPRGRPAVVRRQNLSRAAIVRALMGGPDLLLLERPEYGVYPEIMGPLVDTLNAARKRGAAVLWTTNNPDVWRDKSIEPTLRVVMSGTLLRVAAEGE